MLRFLRFVWKSFIVASVFGIGYVIGREHSFEEDEEWDKEEEKNDSESETAKKDEPAKPSEPKNEPESKTQTGKAVFEYTDPKATSVSVVGDFNDWNKDANPMKNENGVWRCTIDLKPGKHEYKFVINQTDWISDPNAKATAPDKYGGISSIVEVH